MKRFIIVGLGNFGSAVAESLYTQGHDVIAVDLREEAVDRIAPRVSRAAVGDGRQAEVLDRVGAREADAGIIGTGDDITASILATMALRDLRVEQIYVKVVSQDHARVMSRIGVTETIFPERESAQNLAGRLADRDILNYVRLGTGFSIQEMIVPDPWEGKTLRELNLRLRFQLSVVAIHDVLTDRMIIPPDPDAPLKQSDTLLLAGTEDSLRRAADI